MKIDEPQYWSKFTNQHFCIKCAEFEDLSKEDITRFKVPHNLTYIDVKGDLNKLKEIDDYKFGKDKQPSIGEKIV